MAALETGDADFVRNALGIVAKARGMGQVAKTADLNRESLYKALSATGNPEFSTVMRVISALGFTLGCSPCRDKACIQEAPCGVACMRAVLRGIAAYIDAVLEDGDPTLLAHALGVVARAKGMTDLAKETGMGRESLYKSLSSDGNPSFSTVIKVLSALGVKLHATPADA